jgi:hypothetical protein
MMFFFLGDWGLALIRAVFLLGFLAQKITSSVRLRLVLSEKQEYGLFYDQAIGSSFNDKLGMMS